MNRHTVTCAAPAASAGCARADRLEAAVAVLRRAQPAEARERGRRILGLAGGGAIGALGVGLPESPPSRRPPARRRRRGRGCADGSARRGRRARDHAAAHRSRPGRRGRTGRPSATRSRPAVRVGVAHTRASNGVRVAPAQDDVEAVAERPFGLGERRGRTARPAAAAPAGRGPTGRSGRTANSGSLGKYICVTSRVGNDVPKSEKWMCAGRQALWWLRHGYAPGLIVMNR